MWKIKYWFSQISEKLVEHYHQFSKLHILSPIDENLIQNFHFIVKKLTIFTTTWKVNFSHASEILGNKVKNTPKPHFHFTLNIRTLSDGNYDNHQLRTFKNCDNSLLYFLISPLGEKVNPNIVGVNFFTMWWKILALFSHCRRAEAKCQVPDS